MLEILPQLLVVALVISSLYALIATGLTLTFGVLEFIHFGYGEMAMIGAYIFYTAHITLGMSIILGVLVSVASVTLLGIFIEKTTFKPVRNKQAFIPLVLSIGIAILLQSIATMIYGGTSKTYVKPGEIPTTYTFFDGAVTISAAQIAIILVTAALLIGVHLFLKYSRTGKAIRAVADDKQVASILGIDVNKTITILFAMSSGLAAIAGIMAGFDHNLTPMMGLLMSVIGFGVIVFGGVGKFKGAIIGALVFGFAETLIVGLTPIKASYKETILFVIILALLFFRPYGLFGGKKEEVESR